MKIFNRHGMTLIEIMIVVALIGILTAVAVPSFTAARDAAFRRSCNAQIDQLNSAIEMFFIDNGAWPATLTPDLDPYLSPSAVAAGDIFVCPRTGAVYPAPVVAGASATTACPSGC